MSEIESENQYPLSIIFKTNKEGQIIEELSSIKDIPLFFEFLSSEEISDIDKIKFIKKFTEIIKKNRYILEYFSSIAKRLFDSSSVILFYLIATFMF